MDISTFISYFIGTILVIIGTSLFINKKFFKKLLKEMEKNHFAVWISGFIGFFLWLLIIVNYNSFENLENGIITTLGYIITFKSISLLLMPEIIMNICKKLNKAIDYIRYIGIIYIVMGLYLILNMYK